MALTPGAKKLGITGLVAALIIVGGMYFQKHKTTTVAPVATTTEAPAQAPTVPVASEPAPAVISESVVAPIKKQHVAKATVKKHRPSSASHGGSQQESTHNMLSRELTSDQKALQGLAGDKL